MAAKGLVGIIVLGLALVLPLVYAQTFGDSAYQAGSSDDDRDWSVSDDQQSQEEEVEGEQEQATQDSSGPQLPNQPQLLQQPPAATAAASSAPPAAAPKHDARADAKNAQEAAKVKADAKNAQEAAKVAKQAAVVANKVAEHSVKVTGHAKSALEHALGALHDARLESKGMNKGQKESLKKAEAKLREATKTAKYGKLKKDGKSQDVQKEKMQKDLSKSKTVSEREHMRQEIKELRKKLKEKNADDKDVDTALNDLEADLDKTKGPVNDESKAELERLRQLADSLEGADNSEDAKSKDAKTGGTEGESREGREANAMTPMNDSDDSDIKRSPNAEEVPTPVEEKGIDIDTQMPYGDLEPFGREDTAQELTESSISESDEMVDQLERAEVAEEKRAVFRALTRLRGAAITSFDGVARSQTGNIDEYNKIHNWRSTHPLHHLADEESDVSKWAFPDNAD